MLAPRRYGGYELHPTECLRVWEAVARIDASAAWNLVMNQGIANYAAWLPEAGVKELFADGIPTIAGALNPPAHARRVEGGWRVTGQVPFGSGCHHAGWLAMPAMEEGADALFAVFFPRTSGTVLDTWHTIGMRGTGSTDYRADDLFVPEHMVAPVGPLANPAPGFDGPLFHMWPWPNILGEGIISVAVAASALNAAVELCKNKTPSYQGVPLKQQQLPQFLLGKAASYRGLARYAVPRRRGWLRRGGKQRQIAVGSGESRARSRCLSRRRLVPKPCALSMTWSALRQFGSNNRLSAARDLHVLLQHFETSPANDMPRLAGSCLAWRTTGSG